MAAKKLLVKKKKGKLVVHKKGSSDNVADIDEPTCQVSTPDDNKKEPSKKKTIKKKAKSKVTKEVVGEITTKSNNEDSEKVVQEKVDDVDLVGHMANVGFSLSRSVNLGNYENLKVQVSINVPSLLDVDEIDGNYEFAKSWVESKMKEVLEEYED